jgi:hypothetical protein
MVINRQPVKAALHILPFFRAAVEQVLSLFWHKQGNNSTAHRDVIPALPLPAGFTEPYDTWQYYHSTPCKHPFFRGSLFHIG